ncbi:MAG: PH domain-containing protein [Saprospiraceae bacterium]|nr:PH domain-containing protein [Saprospiraceae bacterium]
MKKNEFDFTIPTRQSYVAILMILYKTFTVIFRQMLPVIAIVLIGGNEKRTGRILFVLIGISAVSMIYSIINFFRTYFVVEDDELIIYSGVFNRKKTTIPFEKIQTINFEQNIIHRFFDVTRLKIDTAGTDKNEFEFQALDLQKASALRDILLSKRNKIQSTQDGLESSTPAISIEFKPVMALTVTDLIKVGVTENHLKSGGLILLFFFWIYQNLNEAGVDIDEYSEEFPQFDFGIILAFLLILLFLTASFIISLVRSVVIHYDLKMLRSEKGFKIESGLFTKRETSALDHKIQQIGWSDNLLRKLVGFKNLYLKQASSVQLASRQTTKIPGCTDSHIASVVKSLYSADNLFNISMKRIDIRYFYRLLMIILPFGLIISGVLSFTDHASKIIWIWLVIGYLILNRFLSWRKKLYGFNEELIHIRGGVFGDKAEILPVYKIQAAELSDSPYQRSHQLTNLILHTAAGQIHVPYIPLSEAKKMLDYFIFRTQTDKRKWM